MRLALSVVTPSLPERAAFRNECRASVRGQIDPPAEHLIKIDHNRVGIVEMQNRMLEDVNFKWFMLLADDDLPDADHLRTLWRARAESDADICYSWCRVEGRDWSPNRSFDAEALRHGNFIPAVALIRTSLARDLGGWRTEPEFEDWDFWLRALDAGARFCCVERETWTYRFHGENISWRTGDGASQHAYRPVRG